MTTRHRLLATLALPVGLALLAACGSGDTTTTTTETATAAATSATVTATETPTETSTASPTSSADDDEETSTATGSGTTTRAARPSSSTSPAGEGKVPSSFTALGTEPFWDIQVAGRTLTYSGPDIETKVLEAERSSSGNSATYTGNHEGTAFKLTVTEGSCNDGMSDNEYSYKAEWTWGGETNSGCARN